MIEVEITQDIIDRAKNKAIEMGKLKNSITGGDGNIAGFIGEEVASIAIGGTISNTKDYDLIDSNGITYDVKTKRCTSPPLPEYECSISHYNTVQKCDRYLFVRVECIEGEYIRAWILGYMDREEYYSKARKLYKGQRDGSNWFRVKSDCYNLPISELKNF